MNGSKLLLQNPMLSSMKASYFEKSPYLAWIISSISNRPISPYGCWVQFIVWIPNPSSPLSLIVNDKCHEKNHQWKGNHANYYIPCCMNSSLCCTGAIVKIGTIWMLIIYRQVFRKPIITFYWTKCNKKYFRSSNLCSNIFIFLITLLMPMFALKFHALFLVHQFVQSIQIRQTLVPHSIAPYW